jgi:hypothetical protein
MVYGPRTDVGPGMLTVVVLRAIVIVGPARSTLNVSTSMPGAS